MISPIDRFTPVEPGWIVVTAPSEPYDVTPLLGYAQQGESVFPVTIDGAVIHDPDARVYFTRQTFRYAQGQGTAMLSYAEFVKAVTA